MLHYLLRHRGDVVSKTEILENVWDLNHDGADNVVEVYVGYLRRKIDLPFGRASIETVRGAGYRLAGQRWLTRPPAGGRGSAALRRPVPRRRRSHRGRGHGRWRP